MKKRIMVISFMLIMLFTLTACGKDKEKSEDALKFKEEYEELNRKTNSSGKVHRTISIDDDNPFVYITAEEIVRKMDSKETFYVYFGSKSCPWCRSVIEKAIEVAKDKDISVIYYVDIWDNEGNEILRDKYILNEDNELEQSIKGTDAYYDILERFETVLSDYSLIDENGNKIDVGEKRLYAPSFIYIKDGKAEKLVEGISSKQTDSRSELNDEILEDEKKIFEDFFE